LQAAGLAWPGNALDADQCIGQKGPSQGATFELERKLLRSRRSFIFLRPELSIAFSAMVVDFAKLTPNRLFVPYFYQRRDYCILMLPYASVHFPMNLAGLLSLWIRLLLMALSAVWAPPPGSSMRRLAMPGSAVAFAIAVVQTSSSWRFHGSLWLGLWTGWLGLCVSVRLFGRARERARAPEGASEHCEGSKR
jgi:hypothetical protein